LYSPQFVVNPYQDLPFFISRSVALLSLCEKGASSALVFSLFIEHHSQDRASFQEIEIDVSELLPLVAFLSSVSPHCFRRIRRHFPSCVPSRFPGPATLTPAPLFCSFPLPVVTALPGETAQRSRVFHWHSPYFFPFIFFLLRLAYTVPFLGRGPFPLIRFFFSLETGFFCLLSLTMFTAVAFSPGWKSVRVRDPLVQNLVFFLPLVYPVCSLGMSPAGARLSSGRPLGVRPTLFFFIFFFFSLSRL